MEVGLERAIGAQQRLDRHRRGDVGGSEQQLGVRARKGEHAEHAVGAVDERQPFLGLELQGFQPCGLERRGSRYSAAFAGNYLALADQCEGHACQRREVAAAAYGAVSRDDRRELRVEGRDQGFRHRRPHAGESHRQRARAQEHHRPHDLDIHRRAHARGVRADERQLQLGLPERSHTRSGQGAESRRDPVDRFARRGGSLRAGAAPLHLRACGLAQDDLLVVPGDCDHLLLGQPDASQGDSHVPEP